VSPGPRVLIADGTQAFRRALEPVLRRAGWDVLGVAGTIDVLRAVRDHAVDVVLIDPDLPGAGASALDVVRTLKSATRFRELPVFWLLRDGRGAPRDVRADGALALDGLGDEALLQTLRGALPPGRARDGAGAPDGADAVSESVRRAAEAAIARYCRTELRDAVPDIVRQIAREVVPAIAERLIREEIERLRAEHRLGGSP
jgi:CheY-like chemotaxis protein